MASIHNVVEGLKLLAKYSGDAELEQVAGADHDVIYGGGEPVKWSEEDRATMKKLGWHLYSPSDNYDEDDEAVLDEDTIWARFV